jgi:hypothetical protein
MICALNDRALGAGCPTAGGGCGLNGGWLGGNIAFHELDANFSKSVKVSWLDPAGNAQSGDLRIRSFKPANAAASAPTAQLVVDHDQLKAVRPGRETTDLANWVITVDLYRGHVVIRTFYLTITQMDASPYWTGPGCDRRPDGTCYVDAENVPLYAFTWKDHPNGKATSICGPDVDPDDSGFSGKAVIFTGNHYEPNFTVHTTAGNTQWGTRFNIACVGTALAKLHLHRHTEAAEAPRANLDAQQALLRMLTGDYCGDGRSYTMNGRQLEYTYNQTWYPLYPRFSKDKDDALDAVWNRDGAVCIEKPRLGYTPDQIRALCPGKRLPSCKSKRWKLSPKVLASWSRVLAWFSPFKGYAVAIWNTKIANPDGTPAAPSP